MTTTVYKGWNAVIYKDGVALGTVSDVSIDVDAAIETYYEAGNRNLARVIPGPIAIVGRMSKAFVNTAYLALVSEQTPDSQTTGFYFILNDFTLYFRVGASFALYAYNCSFKKASITIPQDGFLKEDYDFIAKSVALV